MADAKATTAPGAEQIDPADLALAIAAAAGDADALERFDRLYIDGLVPVFAERGEPRARIDEILQDVRAHLLVGDPPRLASYSGSGSLRAFVRACALRLWLNDKRSAGRRSKRETVDVLLDEAIFPSPELEHMKRLYLAEFSRSLRHGWSSLGSEKRLFLRHHLVDHLSIDDLSRLYGIHRSSAARRIAAARDELVAASKKHLADELGLASDDIDSVLRLIRSRLEVDIDALSETVSGGSSS